MTQSPKKLQKALYTAAEWLCVGVIHCFSMEGADTKCFLALPAWLWHPSGILRLATALKLQPFTTFVLSVVTF